MSITKKINTAYKIYRTQGIKGVLKIVANKLDRNYHPDEAQIVFNLLENEIENGLMLDVGAHHGLSLAPFAQKNWRVLAFEPDSNNRLALIDNFGTYPNVTIDSRACSDRALHQATLFASSESTGVSGLSAFLDTHRASEVISVITLAEVLSDHSYSGQAVDFLKIDTEGYDLMVLKGFPWSNSPHPTLILCEFENKKTEPLGYLFHDLANFLTGLGYHLLISEWYPIKAYGSTHRWRGFSTYPMQLTNPNGWGNIFAVKSEPLFQKLCESLKINGHNQPKIKPESNTQ